MTDQGRTETSRSMRKKQIISRMKLYEGVDGAEQGVERRTKVTRTTDVAKTRSSGKYILKSRCIPPSCISIARFSKCFANALRILKILNNSRADCLISTLPKSTLTLTLTISVRNLDKNEREDFVCIEIAPLGRSKTYPIPTIAKQCYVDHFLPKGIPLHGRGFE